MPIVCDASALVEVGLRSERGRRVLDSLRSSDAAAPDLINAEVLHAFRRFVLRGAMTDERARQAIALVSSMALRRVGTTHLMPRIWTLHPNLTAYDATYVALAEALACPLVTADGRLASAPGIEIPLVVV